MGKRKRPRNKGLATQDGKIIYKASDPDAEGHLHEMVQKLSRDMPDKVHNVEHDGIEDKTYDTTRMTAIRTKPISWGFPFDELTYSKWIINILLHHRPMPWDDVIVARSTYLPDARNIIHKAFVTKTDNEWLFMLDSDVVPPPNILERFFRYHREMGAKMMGGWYHKKGHPYPPVVYDYAFKDERGINNWEVRDDTGTGLEKVDGAGAGCWFMHRDVAVALGEEPYDMSEGGEDLTLCRRVTEAGFDIYIDWDMACAHIGVATV